jgi:hypothetical protein
VDRSKPPAPSTIAPLPDVIGPLTVTVPTASARNSGCSAIVVCGFAVARLVAGLVAGLVAAGLVAARLVVAGLLVNTADAAGTVLDELELDAQAVHNAATNSAAVNELGLMSANRTQVD